MLRRLFKPKDCESEEVRKAREAAERAERERRKVEAQAPIAQAIGAAVREILERNHLGEQIDAALARRRSVGR